MVRNAEAQLTAVVAKAEAKMDEILKEQDSIKGYSMELYDTPFLARNEDNILYIIQLRIKTTNDVRTCEDVIDMYYVVE